MFHLLIWLFYLFLIFIKPFNVQLTKNWLTFFSSFMVICFLQLSKRPWSFSYVLKWILWREIYKAFSVCISVCVCVCVLALIFISCMLVLFYFLPEDSPHMCMVFRYILQEELSPEMSSRSVFANFSCDFQNWCKGRQSGLIYYNVSVSTMSRNNPIRFVSLLLPLYVTYAIGIYVLHSQFVILPTLV